MDRVAPVEEPVSIRFRRVQPLLKAGGDPWRAGMVTERPALSCEQPIIITLVEGHVNPAAAHRNAKYVRIQQSLQSALTESPMMKFNPTLLALAAFAAGPWMLMAARPETRVIRVTDTVFVRPAYRYAELERRIKLLESRADGPTVIEGDLIVKGKLGVGGAPEPGTAYGITVRGPDDASIRLISNEALEDPQRTGKQHRHVGSLSLSQDGGLRLDQNSTCRDDGGGCTVDDRDRRRAFSGFDSMGDWSFYLSDVDSLTGKETAPPAQSLVFKLIDWDGNIRIHAHRPGQRFFFNTSTTIHAADRQWEVPFP